MEKNTKLICGIKPSCFIGILLGFVPVALSLFNWGNLVQHIFSETYPLRPDFSSTLIAAAVYLALILRYDFFKKGTSPEIFVSVLRGIVDILILASLGKVAFGGQFGPFAIILTLVLAYLGMKPLAQYAFIAYIILAFINIESLDKAMGFWGAIYILFVFFSFILQVPNLDALREIKNEFNFDEIFSKSKVRNR